ncbi:ChaN family lipoprotein [Nibrella saemangeumensis]
MSDKPAYRLFDQKLKPSRYDKLLKEAAEADVILFGELHNNPICHWLELQLAKDLYTKKGKQLVLGAEMFEADNQQPLNDYLQGKIGDKELTKQARLWNNYDTDYRPIVDFARKNQVPVIASNVPRRYASMVARQGLASLDALPADEKRQIAPLPIEVDLTLPGYKAMLGMMDSAHSSGSGSANDAAKREQAANFPRAQAIKDATMAHFILQNLSPGQTLLHFNGSYHSNNFEGIGWYLRKQRPDLRILTISSVELEDPDNPEKSSRDLANFVITIPADMTKTY